jgi:dipeptidyl aminopeptidase/acylaminoacyl peptidase
MTRRLAVLLTLLAAAAAPVLAGQKPWTSDDVLGLKVVSDPQVSPDGRLVAYVVESLNGGHDGHQTDVWLVPTANGEARAVASSPVGDDTPRWSPDNRWVAREPKSDERKRREKEKDDAWTPSEAYGWNRLWVIEVATRQPRQLTTGQLHVTTRGK